MPLWPPSQWFRPTKPYVEPLPIPGPEAGRSSPFRMRGWSGTSIFAGRPSGIESNPDLQHALWPQVARQMLRTDATLGAAWEATSSTLLSASWVYEPGDPDSPFSRQLAQDANEMFGFAGHGSQMGRDWETALSQMVLYMPVGFRYAEQRFRYDPVSQRVILADPWVDRDPTAHDRWLFDANGQWVGVQQRFATGDAVPTDIQTAPVIPAESLVLLNRGQDGQNLSGTGALRPVYFSYKLKRDLADMSAIAAERWAVGVPNIVVDWPMAQEQGISRGDLDTQLGEVRESVAMLLQQDAAHVETTPYVRLEQFGGDLDPSKILSLIEAQDAALLQGFLLQFLRLGTTNTGARSVGEVHQGTWRRSLINVLDRIAAAFSGAPRPGGGVIGRWVELNHGPVDPRLLPRLRHSGLTVDPLLELVNQLPALTSAGWVNPDMADRNALRRRMGLDPEARGQEANNE